LANAETSVVIFASPIAARAPPATAPNFENVFPVFCALPATSRSALDALTSFPRSGT
jgi:hypothetical protein